MQDSGFMDPRAESALRGMITHTDERFQTLSTRVMAMEDTLVALTNASRELRAAIARGAAASGTDVGGLGEVRDHLTGLERHLAAAFEHLAKRDQALVGSVEQKIEHAAAETREKVESLERSLRQAAAAGGEGVVAIAPAAFDPTPIVEAFEDKVVRLAALVRSDSVRIAELVEKQRQETDAELARMLDARLGRVGELVSATTMSAVNEVARQVPDKAVEAVRERVDDVIAAIDKNFVELADVQETELHRMGRYLSERTAELVDAAIAGRVSQAMERIGHAAEAVNRASEGAGGIGEAAGEDLAAIVDDRITALAKMIRSDNRSLAQIVEASGEQQAVKQTTRAVKELAASMPAQLADTFDRRFDELAERLHKETQSTIVTVAKAADVLSARMDEVEGRYEAGVERAAEKLGEAVVGAFERRRV